VYGVVAGVAAIPVVFYVPAVFSFVPYVDLCRVDVGVAGLVAFFGLHVVSISG
jgi:hypothetical protein